MILALALFGGIVLFLIVLAVLIIFLGGAYMMFMDWFIQWTPRSREEDDPETIHLANRYDLR